MKTILYSNGTLFVAVGSNVVACQYTKSGNIEATYELIGSETTSSIVTLGVSDDNCFLCAGYTNKHVCCWDLSSRVLVGSNTLKKSPTGMTVRSIISNEVRHHAVIVTDKAGDIWAWALPNLANSLQLGGHTASVVTDVTSLKDFIITSDRDEKIRVSKHPDMVTIQSYCLGHTSVVTSVSPLIIDNGTSSAQSLFVVSSSWDHTIKVWNSVTGACVHTIQTLNRNIIGENSNSKKRSAKDQSNGDEESNNDNNNNNNNDDAEKAYDEADAGQYPLKVVVSNAAPYFIAAIFKGDPAVRLFPFNVKHTPEGAELIFSDESERTVVNLPFAGLPTDMTILSQLGVDGCDKNSDKNKNSNSHQLAVLNDNIDHSLYIEEIKGGGGGGGDGSFPSIAHQQSNLAVDWCTEKCRLSGVPFTQQVVSASNEQADGGGDSSMRKHALDKPYNKDLIDPSKNRGAKRSRRRHRVIAVNEEENI